ncbi:MAG: hypothetical protein AAGD11_15345 [Planctomycetota bacterium]
MAKNSKITKQDVKAAQDDWAKAIVEIGCEYMKGKDFVACAKRHIKNLYGYGGNGKVLFKPTKCEKVQFRPTIKGAISYFVGDQFAQFGFSEDQGFAIAPYVAVHFRNAHIIEGSGRAIAMGNYFFTKLDGEFIKVEYTFGYRRRKGKIVIDLHHSSLPYTH